MDIGVMIEGQEGLDWPLWRRLAGEVEALGYESLWRSDHFVSLTGPHTRDALETFLSFVVIAETTRRIRFGPLVTSMTFRHPSLVARMAAQIDVLSASHGGDGRFVLGIGAGWNVPEHEAFGIPFPPVGERMDRLEESIQVVRSLWADGPVTLEGRYYRLQGAQSYPKPAQARLPIIVGGSGEQRTLRIVARHADEWNTVGGGLEGYRAKRAVLEARCAEAGRDPATIRHSQMAGFVIGRDEAAQRAHLARIVELVPSLGGREPAETLRVLREQGWITGTPDEAVEQLGRLQEAGMSRVMLQHHAMRDFETLELVASEVLPQVQR